MENVKVTENEKTEKNVGLTTLSTATKERRFFYMHKTGTTKYKWQN